MKNINFKPILLYMIIMLITSLLINCTSCTQENIEEKPKEGTLIPTENYEDWSTCQFYIQYIGDALAKPTDKGYVYWVEYNDIDSNFDNAIISMDEETFTILLEALDAVQNLEVYSKEWKEVCDKYEFVILYKGNTNVLMLVDKD